MKKDKNFDMNRKVLKPVWYLVLVEWIASAYFRIIGRVKYKKVGFKSYKEPALILANHASMIDMPNVIMSMFPYRVCWVASIEEFQGREWIFRHLGVFPKRKFTNDLIVIKRTAELIRNRKISVCIFPEARFSLAGVNEQISPALGKLAKLCKCRVIVIKQCGNYLQSPQWAKHPYRNMKVSVTATQIISKEDANTLDASIIQDKIEKAFEYDEYKWQYENNVTTRCKKNAENIHRILYKCPNCNKEGFMSSKNNDIYCSNCNSKWHMNPNGSLTCTTGDNKFILVSDWYRWEKQECINEVNNNTYHFEDDVRIEHFVNAKVRFKRIGIIHMIHDNNGIKLEGTLDDGNKFELVKSPLSTRSIHIEYNYKKRGDAIDIATLDDTWFVFPLNNTCLTKFNFAVEAIYDKASKAN